MPTFDYSPHIGIDTDCLFMNNQKETDFHCFILLSDRLIMRKELKSCWANLIQDQNFGGRLLQKQGKEALVSWIEASQSFTTLYSRFLSDPDFWPLTFSLYKRAFGL